MTEKTMKQMHDLTPDQADIEDIKFMVERALSDSLAEQFFVDAMEDRALEDDSWRPTQEQFYELKRMARL